MDEESDAIRLTPRVRTTLRAALEHSQRLGTDFVGTEHVLLALLDDEDGIAGHLLHQSGVADRLRKDVMDIVTSDTYAQDAPPPPS